MNIRLSQPIILALMMFLCTPFQGRAVSASSDSTGLRWENSSLPWEMKQTRKPGFFGKVKMIRQVRKAMKQNQDEGDSLNGLAVVSMVLFVLSVVGFLLALGGSGAGAIFLFTVPLGLILSAIVLAKSKDKTSRRLARIALLGSVAIAVTFLVLLLAFIN